MILFRKQRIITNNIKIYATSKITLKKAPERITKQQQQGELFEQQQKRNAMKSNRFVFAQIKAKNFAKFFFVVAIDW